MMRKRLLCVLAMIVLLVASLPALAEYDDRGAGGFAIGPRLTWVRDSGVDDETMMAGGVLRTRNSVLGLEGAFAYRSESLPADADLRVWPVTASVLLFPVLPVYGVAGLGWYNATLDLPDTSPFQDETTTELGYHLGAGIELPLSPQLRLSGDVRWMFLDYEFEDIPDSIGKVDADALELSASLLIYF